MVGIDVFITAVLVVKFRTLQMGASESSRNILARFILYVPCSYPQLEC